MSDKEQPNKISVKTATITESHEHESSVTEAVDGNLYLYLYPMKFCQLRHTSLVGVIKHNVTISQMSIQSGTKVFTRHMLFT